MIGKSAIVTGAGTGVGKAIAKALLADGFRVALVGRRREVLEAAAAELDPQRANTLSLPADIADAAAVQAAFDDVVRQWGRRARQCNNSGDTEHQVPI